MTTPTPAAPVLPWMRALTDSLMATFCPEGHDEDEWRQVCDHIARAYAASEQAGDTARLDWRTGLPDSAQTELVVEIERRDRWIVGHCDHWLGDHACATCFPGEAGVIPGFKCVVCKARARVAEL